MIAVFWQEITVAWTRAGVVGVMQAIRLGYVLPAGPVNGCEMECGGKREHKHDS